MIGSNMQAAAAQADHPPTSMRPKLEQTMIAPLGLFHPRQAAQVMYGATTWAFITAETARSHLKVIFEKTGTNRQNHLMYLLLSSPAPIALAGMEACFKSVEIPSGVAQKWE